MSKQIKTKTRVLKKSEYEVATINQGTLENDKSFFLMMEINIPATRIDSKVGYKGNHINQGLT